MVPIHWFDLRYDNDNHGFSMKKPIFFDPVGGIIVPTTGTHDEQNRFSLTTHIFFWKSQPMAYAKFSISYDNVKVDLFLQAVTSDANTYGDEIPIYLNCEYQVGTAAKKKLYGHSVGTLGDTCISILFSKGMPTFVSNNKRFEFHKPKDYDSIVTDMGTWSRDEFIAKISTNTKKVALQTWGAVINTFKFYDCLISEQQRLFDYQGFIARYLFDGFNIEDHEEIDVSGGHPLDLELPSDLQVTSVSNFLRKNASSITTPVVMNIRDDLVFDHFVNFWICMTSGVQNYEAIFESQLIGTVDANFDDTGYALQIDWNKDGATTNEAHVTAGEWYMMTFSCRRTSETSYEVKAFVNGELVASQTKTITPASLTLTGFTLSGLTKSFDGVITFGQFPGLLSDVTIGRNVPTTSELKTTYERKVRIDDRGTFYAADLVANESIETLGFSGANIMAKGFALLDEADSDTATYDSSTGIFSVKDFKQL